MGNVSHTPASPEDYFSDASVYERIKPEPSGVRFWYQRNHKFQRLILLIPANVSDWIDTHLQPEVLGSRLLYINWTAKTLYDPSAETQGQFADRISQIKLRFEPDPSKVEQRRIYIVKGLDSYPILPPQTDGLLKTDTVSTLRFPSKPGIIQIQLAGSKPTDIGNTRVEFLMPVADAQDWFIFEGSGIGQISVFDVPDENPPTLPPMPSVGE